MIVASAARGAEALTGASLPLLTNAQQVLDLGVEGAVRSPHPVRLRGVVTYPVSSRPWCYVQDETAGLLVIYTNANYQPSAGQRVEVEGHAGPGEFAAHLFEANVRVLGLAPLPEARPADAGRLAAGEDFGRWVMLEGRVHDVELHPPVLMLTMRSGNQQFTTAMQLAQPMALPTDWLDAKVQVRGVCWTETDRDNRAVGFRIWSPATNWITVLEPGASNVFSRPLQRAKDLRAARPGTGARVRVSGTVTLFAAGRWLFLQDESGPVKARLLAPHLQVGSETNYVNRSYQAALEPGDHAEVVGLPMASGFAPVLADAEYRRLSGGPPPKPLAASIAELLTGNHDGELVTILVRLLDRETHQTRSIVEDVLILQAGDTIFEASLETDRTNSLPALARNAFLQVTGVCTVEVGEWKTIRTVRLFLRNPADARVVGQPPMWASWHVGRILAIAGALVAASLTWIWLLRRRVEQRTGELSQANELLRTSEARYRTLVENAPEAIVVLDTETDHFIEANENAVRLFGIARAGLLQSGPAQLSPPTQPDGRSSAQGAKEKVEAALAGNGTPFEWVHRRADGTDFPSEVRVARLPVPGRRLVIGAISDITERKRAEAEMQNALAKEKELGELKSNFVSMVSHEFRTPLGVIMSSAEILQNYVERLAPERRREVLEDIFQSTRRMADMMEAVLLLGRVEAGKVQYLPAPLDLSALCHRLREELLSVTQQRCPIIFAQKSPLPAARADEALIRHIFTNLLSNAIKYSAQGSPVDFAVERQGLQAVFVVRDRGIGILEADAKQLFQAFHRGHNVGEIPGTGLGMVIVKRCVELHRGSISFESAAGAGTTFTVRLPLFEGQVVG